MSDKQIAAEVAARLDPRKPQLKLGDTLHLRLPSKQWKKGDTFRRVTVDTPRKVSYWRKRIQAEETLVMRNNTLTSLSQHARIETP